MIITTRQRDALLLRRRDGLKDHEIADRLKITRESANRLISRAQRTLDGVRSACVKIDTCGALDALLAA